LTKREVFNGPTSQRLVKSDGHVAIGDDKQGKRVYQFLDSSLDRTHSGFARKAGANDQEQLGAEYEALTRFQRYYCDAGLMASVGSVDLNSLGAKVSSGRSFLASTERQLNARDEVRRAFHALSPGQRTVIEHVVVWDRSLELAGYAIGRKSRTRAVDAARTVLRGAGAALAELWGMNRVAREVA
jgi:hypothetical protein